jgi:hypothetical protein
LRLVSEAQSTVVELSPWLLVAAMAVVLVWLLCAAIGFRAVRRLFAAEPVTDSAPPREKVLTFWLFALVGNLVLMTHLIFEFPPALENFVHLLSKMACVALLLGVALVANRSALLGFRGASIGVMTFAQYLLLVLLYLATGRAAGAVLALTVLVGALWFVRAPRKVTAVVTVSAVIFMFLAFWLKTPIRVLMADLLPERIVVLHWVAGPASQVPTGNEEESGAVLHEQDSLPRVIVSDRASFASFDQNSQLFILKDVGLPEPVAHAIGRTIHRLNHLGMLSLVMSKTPDAVPYWGREAYLQILTALIPRLVWKDKPSSNLDNEFGRRYGILDPRDLRTSVNLNPVTQGWMSAGLLGVCISGLGIGLLFGAIYGWLARGGDQWERLFVFAAVLATIGAFEGDLALVVGGMLQALVMAFAFIALRRWVLARQTRQRLG